MNFKPSLTSATNTTGPYIDGLQVAPVLQASSSVALNSLQQSPKRITFSSLDERTVWIKPEGANSRLWNPYNVAYPADRDFGFMISDLIGGFPASSRVFTMDTMLVVEFLNLAQ